MHRMTFLKCWYSPLNGPLWMPCSMTLMWIFKVELVKWILWQISTGKCKHYYCHQIGSQVLDTERRDCECCTSLLTYIFKVMNFENLISGKRKILCYDFYRGLYLSLKGPLRNLYFVTLTFILNVKRFLIIHFLKKNFVGSGCPDRLASIRPVPAALLWKLRSWVSTHAGQWQISHLWHELLTLVATSILAVFLPF